MIVRYSLVLWLLLTLHNGLKAQNVPNAGSDVDLCAEATEYTLQANAPNGSATASWSVVSKPEGAPTPQFSNTNDPNATVSGLLFPAGSADSVVYVFAWSFQYPSQPSQSDEVSVTRWKTPSDANAGSDLELGCEVASVSLEGNIPEIGRGTWALTKGEGAIAEPNNPSSPVSGLGYGENILTWTIENGSACSPSVSNVTIIRYATPVANAGADTLAVCLSEGRVRLEGNNPQSIPGIATGQWAIIQEEGSLSIEDDTLYNTAVSFDEVGSYRLQWSVTSGTCGTVSDELLLEVFAPPTAAAEPRVEVCTTAGSGRLSANNPANLASTATGQWRVIEAPGNISFTDSSAYNTEFTWEVTGTYQLAWAVANGGGCDTATALVEVVVYEQPQAEAGPAVVSCLPNGPAALQGSNPANLQATAQGQWTLASGPGQLDFDDPTRFNAQISWDRIGVYKLYWDVSNGACGSVRDSVLASVGEAGVVEAGPDKEACFNQVDPPLQLEGNNPDEFNANGAWRQVSGPGNVTFDDPTQYNTGVRWTEAGIYELEWRIFNGCNNQPDRMELVVYEEPSLATAEFNQLACEDPPMLEAVPPAVGQGRWEALGDGAIPSPEQPTTTVEGLGEGVHSFRWTVANGVCEGSSQVVALQVEEVPSIQVSISEVKCFGQSTGAIGIELSGTTAAASFQLLQNGKELLRQESPDFDGLGAGEYEMLVSLSNGCEYRRPELEISEPDEPLTFNGIASFQKPTATNRSDGILEVSPATGGTPPYQYQLQGVTPLQSGVSFPNLSGGQYELLIEDSNGCTESAEVELPNPEVPDVINAFSPNNDGTNDTWLLPFLEDYPQTSVSLFSSWGELLWKQQGGYSPWDGRLDGGKDAPAGVYYYVIQLNNGQEAIKGSLTIAR